MIIRQITRVGKQLLLKQLLFLSAAVLMPAFLTGCGQDAVSESGAYQKGIEALESGDYETAMNQFRTAVDQDSRKAEAYRGEGIIFMKQDEYASAVTMFERALDTLSRSRSGDDAFKEDVQFYLAEAYLNCGRDKEALELYNDLTAGLTPDRAYLMRGSAYVQWQDMDNAMADFDQVIAANPSYENCIKIYEILSGASRKADGAAFLERSLEAKIGNKEDYYNQGLIYYYLGNYEEARKNLQAASDMGNIDAVVLLGKACIENNDTAAAREAYQKVVNDEENRAVAYNGLALCDISDGDYSAALQNISKGLAEDDPAVAESLLFNEVVVYEKMFDFATAKEKMAAFLEKYPDNREAKRENLFLKSR